MPLSVEKIGRAGNRAVSYGQHKAQNIIGISQKYRPFVVSKGSQVAARIHKTHRYALSHQSFHRAIHGIAFCNPAQIDQHGPINLDMSIIDNRNICTGANIPAKMFSSHSGKKSTAHQLPSDCYIEQAATGPEDGKCYAQHCNCLAGDPDRFSRTNLS